jgi:phage tail sheath protein FI
VEQLTRVLTATRARATGAAAGAASATPARGAADKPGLRPRQSDGGYGAVYFPGITTRDPLGTELVDVAPSGHIAGIWARTDATRGVHKAPANEIIRGALNVTQRLTSEDQGVLNPVGVNCIRYFPREGIRVWGARTLADASSEWRYLNVRRLFNMIEESIAEATRWIVFEPNDRTLWKSIRRDIGAFLTRVWRDGALMGRVPEEAFFVKCDEETNPPDSIDAGFVIAFIGIAPVKPAEFVVFRISQHAGGVEIESEGV